VPYKGISLAFTDLIGGNLQMLMPTVRLRHKRTSTREGCVGIAVQPAGKRFATGAPKLPTTGPESGGSANYEARGVVGFCSPLRSCPAPIVKRC